MDDNTHNFKIAVIYSIIFKNNDVFDLCILRTKNKM